MAGIMKRSGCAPDCAWCAILYHLAERGYLFIVSFGIDERMAQALFIFKHDVISVLEHDRNEPERWRSGIDRTTKSCFDQLRQPARMVNVRMRQDDGINSSGIK